MFFTLFSMNQYYLKTEAAFKKALPAPDFTAINQIATGGYTTVDDHIRGLANSLAALK